MLDNCHFVQAELMLLIVFCHSFLFLGGMSLWFENQPVIFKSKGLIILADWLNTFHIYGFTLVLGYISEILKL